MAKRSPLRLIYFCSYNFRTLKQLKMLCNRQMEANCRFRSDPDGIASDPPYSRRRSIAPRNRSSVQAYLLACGGQNLANPGHRAFAGPSDLKKQLGIGQDKGLCNKVGDYRLGIRLRVMLDDLGFSIDIINHAAVKRYASHDRSPKNNLHIPGQPIDSPNFILADEVQAMLIQKESTHALKKFTS